MLKFALLWGSIHARLPRCLESFPCWRFTAARRPFRVPWCPPICYADMRPAGAGLPSCRCPLPARPAASNSLASLRSGRGSSFRDALRADIERPFGRVEKRDVNVDRAICESEEEAAHFRAILAVLAPVVPKQPGRPAVVRIFGMDGKMDFFGLSERRSRLCSPLRGPIDGPIAAPVRRALRRGLCHSSPIARPSASDAWSLFS